MRQPSYAGNPGYVIGLPLVSGTMTADGIVRSINPRDTISVLYSGDNQDCLGGPRLHSPILFGVDFVDATSDWLPVKSNLDPGETHNCSIPVSYHLEIQWIKYGSLVNPQAQLVSIQEIIQTTSSGLVPVPGGSNILPISVSVAFVAASADASPGYRAKPTVDATLPSDFFYPFV